MNSQVFDHRRLRQVSTILLVLGALFCMFPPENPAMQWWADHAVFVALGYLALAMFLLVVNRTRLMFVCLGCSAAISLFKNEQLPQPPSGNSSNYQRSPAEWIDGMPPTSRQALDTFYKPAPLPDSTSKAYESNEF